MHRGALFTSTLALAAAPAAAQTTREPACLPSIADQAFPGDCISASSVPTPGALLPLGPELFVLPTGEVGLGTMSPGYRLDVDGDARLRSRVALGNDATIGTVGSTSRMIDLSNRIADFSASQNWAPVFSRATIDPTVDLTGSNEKYIFGHMLLTELPASNPHDVEYFSGPYLAAWHDGPGIVQWYNGALVGAEISDATSRSQSALFAVSDAHGTGTIDFNVGVEIITGHRGEAGGVGQDFGLYLYTPWDVQPIQSHYGIFLEDQDVGVRDSYAIYSEGGTSYLEGDVGIGTNRPAAKLHVVGDFAASGTKSFVQPHPEDPAREIWFACLEGNEAGTYFRGRAALARGRAVLSVPEEFRFVTEEEGLTVQLTPRGAGAALWIESSDLHAIVVRGEKDLEFDYFVNGVRRGHADFEVVRAKAQAARPKAPVSAPEESRARLDARSRAMRAAREGR